MISMIFGPDDCEPAAAAAAAATAAVLEERSFVRFGHFLEKVENCHI